MKISNIFKLSALLILVATASCDGKKESVETGKITVVNSVVGQFFVVVGDNPEKTNDGFKFDFSIGNKNYADYEDVTLELRWGKNPAKADNAKNKKAKEVKVSLADLEKTNIEVAKLKAGHWQKFSVVIPAKEESDMEILNLSLVGVKKISLVK